MIDTIKEIESYLSSYFIRGSTMGVTDLLDIQDKVAIHSYRLAEMAATAKSDYNGCYYIRKITVNRQMQELIAKGASKAKAEVEAGTDTKQKMKAELDAESEAYKYDMLLTQVNKVLSAIQQRISYLKQEHEHSKISNPHLK